VDIKVEDLVEEAVALWVEVLEHLMEVVTLWLEVLEHHMEVVMENHIIITQFIIIHLVGYYLILDLI
jgi:hypothetical protein